MLMYHLEMTLGTPAENLALDEALLDWAEDRAGMDSSSVEVTRLWEPAAPFVVTGRSSRISDEVDQAACAKLGIPVLRRSSGGAAIVAGPGCLMYAVVLSYDRHPDLQAIDRAHAFVLGRIGDALRRHIPTVQCAGTSDLVLSDTATSTAGARKFSGNSMRSKRTHFLYHGTLLYDFDLSLISTCLRMPPRQPGYRQARNHHQFVMNVPMACDLLRESIRNAWHTNEPLVQWPRRRVRQLVEDKYSRDEWNGRLP